MNAALRTEHSVHYVSVQRAGPISLTMVCDVGRTSGIQRITFRKSGKTGHVTVIVARTYRLRPRRRLHARGLHGLQRSQREAFSRNMAASSRVRAPPTHGRGGRHVRVRHHRSRAGREADRRRRQTDRRQGGEWRPRPRRANRVRPSSTRSGSLRRASTSRIADDRRGAGRNTIEFSDWGKPVDVRAPRGAVDPTKPEPTLPVA